MLTSSDEVLKVFPEHIIVHEVLDVHWQFLSSIVQLEDPVEVQELSQVALHLLPGQEFNLGIHAKRNISRELHVLVGGLLCAVIDECGVGSSIP